MSRAPYTVEVVVPVYNEEQILEASIRTLRSYLDHRFPFRTLVTVADNGPGMTAEQASRVFERFYRTDDARSRARGGTGLGLSIAAALVESHGGTITVDPRQPGGGATFRVRLPLARPADNGTPADDGQPAPRLTRLSAQESKS